MEIDGTKKKTKNKMQTDQESTDKKVKSYINNASTWPILHGKWYVLNVIGT